MTENYQTPPLAEDQDRKVMAANFLKEQQRNERLKKLLLMSGRSCRIVHEFTGGMRVEMALWTDAEIEAAAVEQTDAGEKIP
jgi:hypothetical protein